MVSSKKEVFSKGLRLAVEVGQRFRFQSESAHLALCSARKIHLIPNWVSNRDYKL